MRKSLPPAEVMPILHRLSCESFTDPGGEQDSTGVMKQELHAEPTTSSLIQVGTTQLRTTKSSLSQPKQL